MSFLSSLGEVVEEIMVKRLKKETETLRLLPDEQFGFTKEHSLEQQLLRST